MILVMNTNRKRFDQSFLQKLLHILILFGIAVAYPSFQALAGSATFFVAGQYDAANLIVLTVALCFLIPAILAVFAGIMGHRRLAGRIVYAFFVFVLISAIVLPLLNRFEQLSAPWIFAIAFLIGAAMTALYVRYETARSTVTLLGPLLLIVPGLFLFDEHVSKIVWRKQNTEAVIFEAKNPVIVIVFDELPLKSLLDHEGNIDAQRFPNFASFASKSTWYRNATTVSDNTIFAVPAILTGKYPDPHLLPIRVDHPKNMISLFENGYEVHAYENASKFSKKSGANRQPPFWKRNFTLVADLSLVYLHRILPYPVAKKLPSIQHTWGNFWQLAGVEQFNARKSRDDRAKTFRRFISSIRRSPTPTFYFMHSMLPHVPWQHFASGKQYNGVGIGEFGIDGLQSSDNWLNDPNVVSFAFKRHLIQVEFVDRLFGEFIDQLKHQKIYNRALIVIVSDHGACFHPGHLRRRINPQHYEDVMRIPLWIKAPHQTKGSIDGRNAQTIDVFPTILDILNIGCGWRTDGRSLVHASPDPGVKIAFGLMHKYEFPFPQDASFGSGDPPQEVQSTGDQHLIGKKLAELVEAGKSPVEIHLHNSDAFQNVQLQRAFVPALITAHMDSESLPVNSSFGIVVNGTVNSISQPFRFNDETAYVSSLVSESAFQQGQNHVEIVIFRNGTNEYLRPRLIHGQNRPTL